MKKQADENVKAGLQKAANALKNNNTGTSYKDAAKETDADDRVHEKDEEINSVNEELDMDDVVHRSPVLKTVMDNEERDADDLVHQTEDYTDE